MKVGFIGTGKMGAPMALNLVAAGYEVTVYNRSRAKIAALLEKGAKPAGDVAGACDNDVVVTMVSGDPALESIAYGEGGILANLPAGAVHMSSSTISVALAGRLAADHAAEGQRFVSAPVFGRPDMATAGQLAFVAAGARSAVDKTAPLCDAMGKKTFVVSETPGDANLVKLGGNFLIASVIESLGEAMALVGKAGIDRHRFLEIMTSTLFGAPVYQGYGRLIAEGRFEPAGFAAPLGQKDIKLALAAAEDLHVPLPLASLIRDRFVRLLARGGDQLDWSAIAGLAAEDAGVG